MSLELLGVIEIGADFGDNMVEAFNAAQAAKAPAASSLADVRAGKGVVKRGMRGDLVKFVQQRVSVPDDGDFGAQTEAAVQRFQGAIGVAQTGVVDAATLTALDAVPVNVIHETAPPVNPWAGTQATSSAAAQVPAEAPKSSSSLSTWAGIGLLLLAAGGVAYVASE